MTIEYKIINDDYNQLLEQELNSLAQDGWFVVAVRHNGIILGRNAGAEYQSRMATDLMERLHNQVFS